MGVGSGRSQFGLGLHSRLTLSTTRPAASRSQKRAGWDCQSIELLSVSAARSFATNEPRETRGVCREGKLPKWFFAAPTDWRRIKAIDPREGCLEAASSCGRLWSQTGSSIEDLATGNEPL